MLTVMAFPSSTNWPAEICEMTSAGWVASPLKVWGVKVKAIGPFKVTVPLGAAPLMVAGVVAVPLAFKVTLLNIV